MDEPGSCNYQLRRGHQRDRLLLLQFLEQAYQEQYPTHPFTHLKITLDQYWSDQTPVWFMDNQAALSVGCLWAGDGYDQITGDRYTHIFLVYVAPEHRCQGLGRRLLNHAEQWAYQRGNRALGLQVFIENHIAQSLYHSMGYHPRSTFLLKSIPDP
jgi:ribosomal protein S18 acetylase RimI-like enzyme